MINTLGFDNSLNSCYCKPLVFTEFSITWVPLRVFWMTKTKIIYIYIYTQGCLDFRMSHICIGRPKCAHHLENVDVSGRTNYHIP
jgi:hypothetical protein